MIALVRHIPGSWVRLTGLLSVLLAAGLPCHTLAAGVAGTDVFDGDRILSVVASLAAVLLMVLVLGFLAKKFGGPLGGNPLIKVLSNLSVGSRERVVLIEVCDQRVLIGASPGSVSLLHVFDRQAGDAEQSAPTLSIIKEQTE